MMQTTKFFLPVLTLVLFIMTAACNKQRENVLPVRANRISKIVYDNYSTETAYDSDSRLLRITSRQSNGNILDSYTFQYNNGRISNIVFGGKWKYSYTGNLVTAVETVNLTGDTRYRTELSYSNAQLTEKTEYLVRQSEATPYMKTKYTFNAEGNVLKREIYTYTQNEWKKTERIYTPEYDRNCNSEQQLESYPFLPNHIFSVNNPMREIHVNDAGEITETILYEYDYDAVGRAISRKATHKLKGFPDLVENAQIMY